MNLPSQKLARLGKYRYLLVALLLTASCSREHSGNKDTEIDDDNRHDQTFAVEASYSNLAEIKMGELAQSKAVSEEVVQFAERMVTEHTAALQRLRSISNEQGIKIPDTLPAQHRRVQDEVSALEGEAFDSAYMHQQIQAHEKAQELFRSASTGDGGGGSYADYAKSTLEHINAHLARAKEIVDPGNNPASAKGGNQR